MDDAVPQSVFVVVSWDSMSPCCISILQLETHKQHKHNVLEYPADLKRKPRTSFRRSLSFSSIETQLNQKEYVAHFNRPQGPMTPDWVFSPPTSSSSTSTDELYMLPYWIPYVPSRDVRLHGSVFNFRTKTCRPIPPNAMYPINIGHAVSLGSCIYVTARPNWPYERKNLPFLCYDPAKGWYSLESFPGAAYRVNCIMATAVWNDTILYIMRDDTVLYDVRGCEMWAYDVERDEWCRVEVEDNMWCNSIEGEAIVLGNTIYALTKNDFNLVLALSIKREDINGDLRFVCSLRSMISMPGILKISFDGAQRITRHLVHLGKDNFCLVQSCNIKESFGPCDYQPIQLTNMKLIEQSFENSMIVIDECVHLLRVTDCEQFHVELCFSMPECKTNVSRQGKNFCFDLDPFPEDYDPKQKFNTDTDSESEEETLLEDGPLVSVHPVSKPSDKSNATSEASTNLGNGAASQAIYSDAEGHSFYVRNLLPDATFGQFKEELKKFRPSERFEIQFEVGDTVSAIITEGCRDEMEEESRLGLTIDLMSKIMITEGRPAVTEEERRSVPSQKKKEERRTGLTEGKKENTVSLSRDGGREKNQRHFR